MSMLRFALESTEPIGSDVEWNADGQRCDDSRKQN